MERLYIIARVKIGEGKLAEFDQLAEEDRFYYPDTDEGRQRYLDESKAMIDELIEPDAEPSPE